MIFPPALYSEDREEYDILELEVLSRLAIEAEVHMLPEVKNMFERLFEAVGTREFAEDYCVLQKFVLAAKLHPQVVRTSERSMPRPEATPTRGHRQALFIEAMGVASQAEKALSMEVC